MSCPHPPFYKWHFEMVPIEKIVEHIKEKWDPERVADLIKDIQKNGLTQPLQLISNGDDTYEIDDGNHRLKALKQLGWKKVPAMVFD